MAGNIIASDQVYSKAEIETLALLMETVIPSSGDGRFPAASDSTIFEDFVSSSEQYRELIITALQLLNEISGSDYQGLSVSARLEVTQKFYSIRSAPVSTLLSLVAQCYYRDDRVLKAIGLEPRAPHPKGFEVEQGDWGLLEPVKKRGKIYRDA